MQHGTARSKRHADATRLFEVIPTDPNVLKRYRPS